MSQPGGSEGGADRSTEEWTSDLQGLGWGHDFARALAALPDEGLQPARVGEEHRGMQRLLLPDGQRWGEVTGRLLHDARNRLDLPAVGDWVAVRQPDAAGDSPLVIQHILPRRSAVVRRAAGPRAFPQVVAANVDAVFIVTAMDRDFNPRRLERYLATVNESGAEPIIVLNKADLAKNRSEYVRRAKEVAPGITVVVASMVERSGLDALREHLGRGRTVVLVGSSGVGKSTVINELVGRAIREVGAVREHDHRGRHITTHRAIVPIPAVSPVPIPAIDHPTDRASDPASGGLLIDTPGIRELQLWVEAEAIDATFEEIDAITEECRFRDCGHEREPGCAVLAAVEDGRLTPARLTSYRELQQERTREESQRAPQPKREHTTRPKHATGRGCPPKRKAKKRAETEQKLATSLERKEKAKALSKLIADVKRRKKDGK